MASLRSSLIGFGLLGLAAAACGGSSGTNPNVAQAGAAGVESSGGHANGAGAGGSGANSGGTTSKSGGTSNGGDAGAAGAAGAGGSANGGTNAGGAEASDATACETIDDCVIATVYGNSGCCARTDCGSALNRDWVLNEPCASADVAKDPVPQSCSKGCNACPASHCEEPVGVACNAGQCQTISMEGPCATDADCVLALDYTMISGACCGCVEVVSKAFEAAESCVELDGAPKPAGCTVTNGNCAVIDCAACAKPKPTCEMGRCVPH
jgi:hypothetical protein